MNNELVVFVNVRRTHLERGAVFEAAHRLGYGVALLADAVPEGLPRGIVRTVVRLDTRDEAAVHAAVDEIAAEHRIAAVLGWSERDVTTVSGIAQRLGLPGVSPGAARLARNKYLMREAVAEHHPHLVPRFARVTDWSDLSRAVELVGFPAVLKPTSSSGSRGIFVIDGPAGLRPAFDRLMDLTATTETRHELIYEEFLHGTEHSVEGFVHCGQIHVVGVIDKRTTEPFRLELAHLHPSALPADRLDAVHRLTADVVSALGLDDCAFHLECMVAPDGGVRLVEIGARGGGDFIASHLVGLATGRSFVENAIRVATGRPPLDAAGPPLWACVRKILTDRVGTLTGYAGLDDACRVPGVRHLVIEQPVGAEITQPPVDFKSCILGAVITVGDSAEAAEGSAEQAAALVRADIS
ncbi:Biotin carboxylase [Streptoalloteichus tenebrarius]|uniref:Biotin carboxylase n=1 Tax=Streptoalloteichus tenebrarius (strain ATCC 17920 / DSM 40477 / JCM 4838 / CBS 697.72 / NBRC 16177 / NCIMB 11028 / NRRL B-12390 / A12253. 1 / ISP 5477) TaxID=1933 RepID=Q2MF09_STRSD|nr:ATP-grasp domain-containing protein [Streptoalloteichus tenebrarius]MCP2261264.1 Biotin carboxylase [Streptoalloteichus tenebrarius]CAH18563.1 putative carbamoyl-phosphate synthase, TobL [Streptoalloteichus tenebrarius]